MLFNYVNRNIPSSFSVLLFSIAQSCIRRLFLFIYFFFASLRQFSLEYDTALFIFNATIRVNSRSNLESEFLDHVRLFSAFHYKHRRLCIPQ
jgi:hypothetical protein